ncbi:DIS3-like exonuclease 2 [Trichoplusia ni]|uniref:DIS3-like exonuclease 2 n=1 Tax=Trichoplusia ni TaxID=7111 RepID=A0A7E5VSR1_TRINI|nr:DIS3-like exonuclease 2 [Trichoplusia ni]
MSHLCDCISERNFDVNRPSGAQLSTSQPLRSKSSLNNRVQDHQNHCPAKKSHKHSSVSRHKQSQGEAGITSQTFTNSSISDISTQCQNLNVNSESDEVDQGDSPVAFPKRKNQKKKERLKQLKIPSKETMNTPHSSQSNKGRPGHNDVVSLHEFFANQISPLYAATNSRYLENLRHHPQFQLSNSIPIRRDFFNNTPHAASLPNTPLLQSTPLLHSVSIPNSPNVLGESMSPKCIQNFLQHPLLSQSFNVRGGEAFKMLSLAQVEGNMNADKSDKNNSPSKKKNKKKSSKESNDLKFDPYISAEEAEAGLKENGFVEGLVRINPKQFQHAYISSSDRSEQDILIDGIKNRNRALEGDCVVVQLLDSDTEENTENKQKKGKVVYIKEKHHNRNCVGSLKLMPDKNRQRALFIPRDLRIPRLNIPFTSWPDNFYNDAKTYENTLFLAKVLDWTDTRFAMGKIVCNMGQSGDMVSETKAILSQTDLDVTPFGPEVRHLYPRLDYKIPDEELSIREDCRKLCVFSIDPFNCRDIDDAVSCRELENGNYEIGVHIADVAHFLTEDTILDEKVAEKATTIYLVERAYHMLPDDLCMLCSLFPGVDKLAFSVFWEITKNAEVLSHRFAKTVINSCCQLAYEHAQAVLDDKEDSEEKFPETYNGFVYKDIYKAIKIIGSISAKFRKHRFDNGALRIDQPKVAFHLNGSNGLPDSFWIYESTESHQLIEEFMLLANMTVAKRIREDHPTLAFLRCHPKPSGYMLKQLAKSLKPMGIDLEIDSAGHLHRSLLAHVGPQCTDKGKVMVLNMLCAKPMTRARYFCADGCDDDDFAHYALNVPLYTHFTSPIRRYADIMVHRLLAASLNYRETPKWQADKVRSIAAQCNKQKYNAKKASELSTEMYTLKYIEMKSPLVTDAAVVEVREKYIDVIIIIMGLNRRIFFNNDFPGKFQCIKNEGCTRLSKMELTWNAVNDLPEIKQVIQVFSILQVELYRGDEMTKVETKLVRPQTTTSL